MRFVMEFAFRYDIQYNNSTSTELAKNFMTKDYNNDEQLNVHILKKIQNLQIFQTLTPVKITKYSNY